MEKKDIDVIAAGMAPVVREYVRLQLEPLQKRIAELETRESNFRYLGTWQPAVAYREQNFVSYDGSLFHCNRDTHEKPGASNDWSLCVKRGKDAR